MYKDTLSDLLRWVILPSVQGEVEHNVGVLKKTLCDLLNCSVLPHHQPWQVPPPPPPSPITLARPVMVWEV